MNKIYHHFFLFVTLLLSSSLSFSQNNEIDDSPFYVGIGIGAMQYEDDDIFAQLDADDDGFGIKLYGGYEFSPYFSIEATFVTFEGMEANNAKAAIDTSFSALAFSFVGQIPTESGFSFYASAGIGFVSVYQDIHYVSPGANLFEGAESESSGTVVAGAGITYAIPTRKEIRFRLGWERYYHSVEVITIENNLPVERDNDQELDLLFFGVAYHFF